MGALGETVELLFRQQESVRSDSKRAMTVMREFIVGILVSSKCKNKALILTALDLAKTVEILDSELGKDASFNQLVS